MDEHILYLILPVSESYMYVVSYLQSIPTRSGWYIDISIRVMHVTDRITRFVNDVYSVLL